MTGTIILAHGSKRPETKLILDSIISKVSKKSGIKNIDGAYLQLCEPLLEEVLKKQYENGIRNIKVMPLFLFDGIHVLKDIPEYIEEITKELPGLEVTLTSHIGDDDRIADIVIDRIS